MNFKLAILILGLVGSISCGLRDIPSRIYIGTMLNHNYIAYDPKFKQLAHEEFNMFTPGNEMKIDATEPHQNQFTFNSADQLVAFGNQYGLRVRGHTLVWHNQVPGWMNALTGTALKNAMVNHINHVVGYYKGKLYAWDVCNEVLNEDGTIRNSIWSRAMNSSFIALAFRTAHQADPNAKLYINDYNTDGINAKSTGLYNLVKSLLSQGVPIHGVGFQGHFEVGHLPSTYQANLQRFADLGLEVAITELDIAERSGGETDQKQANDFANAVKSCKAVSRCVGVTICGISDKTSWIGANLRPLPWDKDYNRKAAYSAIENALKN